MKGSMQSMVMDTRLVTVLFSAGLPVCTVLAHSGSQTHAAVARELKQQGVYVYDDVNEDGVCGASCEMTVGELVYEDMLAAMLSVHHERVQRDTWRREMALADLGRQGVIKEDEVFEPVIRVGKQAKRKPAWLKHEESHSSKRASLRAYRTGR